MPAARQYPSEHSASNSSLLGNCPKQQGRWSVEVLYNKGRCSKSSLSGCNKARSFFAMQSWNYSQSPRRILSVPTCQAFSHLIFFNLMLVLVLLLASVISPALGTVTTTASAAAIEIGMIFPSPPAFVRLTPYHLYRWHSYRSVRASLSASSNESIHSSPREVILRRKR